TSHFAVCSGSLLRIPTLKQTSLRDFVDGQQVPFKRPPDMSSEEALVFVDFLQGALALDPDYRKTAHELLEHEWLADIARGPGRAVIVAA
nr:hypothetical protein [Tanacetum cinerariifolium]